MAHPLDTLEEHVDFEVEFSRAHGVLTYPLDNPIRGGVLLLPPHPALGGNCENNVIVALARSHAESGYATLRFDYRGVGRSRGAPSSLKRIHDFDPDHPDWQQIEADVHDALMALNFLDDSVEGAPLHAIGYSYGAGLIPWLRDAAAGRVQSALAVSPPWNLLMSAVRSDLCAGLHLAYAANDLALPQHRIATMRRETALNLHRIRKTDHFYRGAEDRLSLWAFNLLKSQGNGQLEGDIPPNKLTP